MACSRSEVRPSWRKNKRCPRPHSETVWQRLHPTLSNNWAPFWVEGVGGAGTGGALRRAKVANCTTSEELPELSLAVAPPLSVGAWSGTPPTSSGEPLKTQPATAERSLGKSSLETPCSTL